MQKSGSRIEKAGGIVTCYLTSASKSGSCLILPIGKAKKDYSGEYFVIEYITPDNYYEGLFKKGGIRIFHVDANMDKEGNQTIDSGYKITIGALKNGTYAVKVSWHKSN